MTLDLLREKGVPLDKQRFTWSQIVRTPPSKLDTDPFTRTRIILMNGIEADALRTKHAFARMANGELRVALARIRRVEQHQQTAVNWNLAADLSPLETTLSFEQLAIELTAHVAQHEPDPYMAQVYRFGLLEDFDHLYRYSALMDRLGMGDPNAILGSYTDILPGRPTSVEHRDPTDDLREHYQRVTAAPLTKLNAMTITAAENQTHDYYMTVGPQFADRLARMLYAEIASIEEQHVTQYEALIDPSETMLEKWLMHEATEVWNYWSCLQNESDPGLKKIWQQFLDFELGHLHFVGDLMKKIEKRDPAELLPATLPEPIEFDSHRHWIRDVLRDEVDLRANGKQFVTADQESAASLQYRKHMNSDGSPSDTVALGWAYQPGGELAAELQPQLLEEES